MKFDAAAVLAQVIATTRAADRPDNLALTLLAVTTSLVDLGIADMAGLTERVGFDRFSTTAATEPAVNEADALQYRLNEGPCVAAIYDDGVVVSCNVTDDQRWPRWGPQAATHGVRAALSVHLYTNRGTFGALNLYKRDPHDYTSDDLDLAKIFGCHVSIVLSHYRNDQNLWKAVDSRHRIGQAQGILMHKYDLDEAAAFAVLRRLSQTQNVKLQLIADHIVRTKSLPGLEVGGTEPSGTGGPSVQPPAPSQIARPG